MCFKNNCKPFEMLLKKEKGENQERLIALYDFAEGRSSVTTILNLIQNDEKFIDFCVNRTVKDRRRFLKERLEYVKNFTALPLEAESALFLEISFLFILNNIKGNYLNSAHREMQLISESIVGPFQLSPSFLIELSKEQMPKNLSEKERREWYTQKTLEICRYDEYPPFNCDFLWPFYEGRPMIFSHQKIHEDKISLYFYDEKTGKKKTLTDYV